MRSALLLAALSGVLLFASGCSDDSGGTAPAGLATDEFGLTFAELTDRAEQGEVLIGECMREAGFEYVPVDFDTIRSAMTSDKSAPGLTGSEFRAEFGFGISTQADKPIVQLGRGVDNVRIFDDLPAADRTAYLRTLYGDHADATWAYSLELEDMSRTGGCTRVAAARLFTPEELSASYFNPADALIEEDERIQDALLAYTACMNAAGFEYVHPDEVEDDIFARFDEITEGRDPDDLTGSAAEDLLALQDRERAVAPVTERCEVTELEPVEDQVEHELFGG